MLVVVLVAAVAEFFVLALLPRVLAEAAEAALGFWAKVVVAQVVGVAALPVQTAVVVVLAVAAALQAVMAAMLLTLILLPEARAAYTEAVVVLELV